MFEYWTFGNQSAVVTLLNGIAAMLSPSSSLVDAVKLSATLAFIFVVMAAAFKADPKPLFQWFFAIMLGWYALFVPRVSMVVNHASNTTASMTSPSVTVSNVPIGLAFVASMGSKLNLSLTNIAETAFALPESANFVALGLMGPHRMVLNSNAYTVPSQTLSNDWQTFFQRCTWYDINYYSTKSPPVPGIISYDELMRANDPLSALGQTNSVMFLTIQTGNPSQDVLTCNEAYARLAPATVAAAGSSIDGYAKAAFPDLTPSEARNEFVNALHDSNQLLFRSSVGVQETILNKWMSNLLMVREMRQAVSSNNTALAMVELGAVQAQMQRVSSYLQSARAAQDTVPSIRNVMEAVCIALFPVVLIIMMLAGLMAFRIFIEWAMLFLSLQLWGFCYAVMNFIMVSKTSANIYSLVNTGGSTFTSTGNMWAVSEEVTADMAMAGSMAWAIPVICYGLVRGLGAAAGQMASSMASPAQSTAEQAGAQGGSGNFSAGRVELGRRSSDSTATVTDGMGSSVYDMQGMNGRSAEYNASAYRAQVSSSPGLQVAASKGFTAAMTNEASKLESTAESKSVAATEMRASAVGEAYSEAKRNVNSQSVNASWASQGRGSFSSGVEATEQVRQAYKQATGASETAATQAVLGAGSNIPILKAGIDKKYGANAASSFDKSTESMSSQQRKTASDFVQSFTNDVSAQKTSQGSTEKAKALDASLRQSSSLQESAKADMQQASSLRQAASHVSSNSAGYSQEFLASNPAAAKALTQLLHSDRYKDAVANGNHELADTMIAGELGAHGFSQKQMQGMVERASRSSASTTGTPQSLPGGGASPSSGSLNSSFDAASGGIRSQGNASVDATYGQLEQKSITMPNTGRVISQVSAGQGSIQGDVASQGGAISGQSQSNQNQVEPNLPNRTDDGTLNVPQSQGAKVMKSVGKDVTNTANNVAQTVENTHAAVVDGIANKLTDHVHWMRAKTAAMNAAKKSNANQ